MKLLFLDTETTGTTPDDRMLQLAYRTSDGKHQLNSLYNPGVPINLVAMATHHITEEMVAKEPPFQDSPDFIKLNKILAAKYVLVAHNAAFDLRMLAYERIQTNTFIDTLKIVKHLDDNCKLECYKLQYLRYLFKVKLPEDVQAHDAWGDILVLEAVFHRLMNRLRKREGLKPEEAVDRMIEISGMPTLIKMFQFGKHKDKLVADVAKDDRSYLEWLRREKQNEPEPDADWLFTLSTHLDQ